MKPPWTTWRCRSNANLFLLTFAGFIIVLLLIGRNDFGQYLIPALIGVGVSLLVLATCAIYRAWPLRRQQVPRTPLSRDELRKARSKLVKNQKNT